ncbi:hypothetical protein [Geomicrobium sediminis]|uniref:DUF2178 domain-containing protein n=1 Tax=Geomicrobium sediminis TaxID=1347788 RepID=A0ABS2PCH6_9BACL|nr:hypothetical protein [Geomicrobium sediminis]MBM7633144.1 hypothetical protein [Geomicrobium sediminis]
MTVFNGVALAIVIGSLLFIAYYNDWRDERSRAVVGKASSISFFVGLVASALFLVMYETGQFANFTDTALLALASIVMLHAMLVFVFHRYVV